MLGINLTLNNVTLAARTLAQQAGAILRSFGTGAHVYMPGVGFMNGLQAGNYLESTGQTPLTVDQPTGLVLDTMGSLGPNLIGGSWVVAGGATASFGDVTLNSGSDTYAYQDVMTVGRTYQVEFDYSVISGVSGLYCGTNTGSGDTVLLLSSLTGVGSFSGVFKAGSARFIFRDQSGCVVSIENCTLNEVTGIQASQATTANKPILRRGAVNLLTYSGDFSNAAWALVGTASKVGSTLSIPSLNDAVFHTTTAAATASTGAVMLSGTGSLSLWLFNSTDFAIGLKQITLTSEPTLYFVNATPTVAGSTLRFGRRTGDTATSVTFGGAALFKGTYTAQQIQALGGIPLTTTAPASTTLGPYYWEFDGVNDSLVLGSVPFQISDDFALIAGASQTSATQCAVISVDNGAANAAMLFLNSRVPTFWINAGGTSVGPVCGAQQPLGAVFVASGVKRGSNAYARLNGVQGWTNSTSTVGTGSYTAGRIGYNTVASGDLSGAIYPVITIKGTVSDAQLLTLEKWVASASGITI